MYLQLRGGVDELPAGSMPGGAPCTLKQCMCICVFEFVYLLFVCLYSELCGSVIGGVIVAWGDCLQG